MGKRIDCFDKIKHKEVKQLQQAFNDLVPEDTDLSEQEQKEIGKKIALDYYKQVNQELSNLKEKIAGQNDIRQQVDDHNAKVKNNYGDIPFKVIHDGGIETLWTANSRGHLDALLTIEKNSGYIQKIEKIIALPIPAQENKIEKIEQEAEKEIKKVDPKIPASKLPVKARVAQRKVRDEKAAADLKAKLLALKNLGKNGGITLTSGGIDPKKFELATEIIAAYIKQGVYKFSDIIEDAYAAMGEGVKELYDMLKSAYGAYYFGGADQMDAEQMDLSERNLTFDEITHDMSSEEVELEDFEKVENSESRRQFIDAVKERIEKQEKQNIVSLRKLAADLGIDVVDTNLQEMAEMAVVELSRDMANKSWQEKYILEGIIDIYDNQPTISMRSANRIELQQYSTPAPTAYIAGLYVAAGKPGSVFEPSAGNGIMTIAFKPEIVTVNEIDPVRLDNLAGQGFQQVTNRDALQPFQTGKRYEGLVMNPPFGSSEQIEVDGYKIAGLAQKMAINALTNLKPNGRAAIIIGGHSEFDDKGRITSERTFFNWLYNQYNVAAVINISGDLYAKQGTQFPTRLILIHSKKAVAEGATPINKENQVVTSYYELLKIVNSLKDATYENILQPGLDADRNDGDAIHGKGADQLQPDNEGRLPAIPPGQVRPNSSGRPSSKGNAGTNNGNVTGTNTSESDTNGISADDNADGRISDLEADVSEQQPGTGNIGGTGIGNISGNQPVQSARKFESGELSGKAKVPYVPKSSSQSVDTVIPSRMATDAENILTQINNEYGGIDNFVQKKLGYATKAELFNALSGEQVDAVAMTIVQIENGQGMIIGDMTGVGKGRIAAAVLRYGINHGLKPIFLTETPGLFSDLYRDLVDIDPTQNKSWSKNVKPFIVNDKNSSGDPTITDKDGNVVHKLLPATTKKGIFANKQIPKDANFVLATYSQFGTSSDRPSAKKDFFASISEGNILILDESHNVAGQSNRGEFFKEAIASSKGVLYLSATFAKTPQAMPVYAMKTAMQEANMSNDELVRAIEHGGVALQEVVAAQLVESGQMLRRERSFDGVSVDYEVLEETGEAHRQIADSVTEIVRDIIDFQAIHVAEVIQAMDDIAVAAGSRMVERGGTNMAGVNNTPFASKVFNVIDQLLFSIKALDIADAAIEELKANRKPVIGFKSTMGSFLDHIGAQPGERLEKIDFSLTLKRALEGVMRYSEKDAQGNSRPGTISLADLSEQGREEYQRILGKILKASSGITISPIDVMIKRIQDAGYTVKEITGRNIMLDIQDDGSAIVTTRFEKDKKKIVREFNEGDLDVVMLNMSGATGISMHASSKFKDQRQRVMIDGQLELDINKAVQKRGRIDRVGQVVRGAYRYIVSAIQAESRLLMMFKRKLKSLDANTTSSQKSIKTADVVDFLNKYGDEIVTEYLKENRELNDKLLDPLKFNDKSDEDLDGITKIENAALKVTGRVAILPTREQNEFYKEVSDRYTDYIEYLESNNSNDLEVKVLPLNAKTLTSDVIVEGKGGDSPFGNPSILEQIETDVLKKPLKKADIDKEVAEGLDGLTPEQKSTEISDGIEGHYDGVIEQGIAKLEAQHEKNKISVARNARDKAIEAGSQDVEGDVAGALERLEFAKNEAIKRLETRTNFIKNDLSRFARYFKIGNLYEVPISVRTDTTIGTSRGIFLGFGIKKNRKNPYAPSSINMRFAVNDSRRIVSIPLSKKDFINAVIANSQFLTQQAKQNFIDNWDSLQSTRTREHRFMVTGNLLQAFGTNDGQLVSYTDDQGNLLKGILLPESYKVQEQKRRIPINQGAQYLQTRGNFITTVDRDVVIKKEATGYTLTVPLTKKAGGKYFLNKDLQALVNERGFNQMAGKMTAYFSDSKLQDILDFLYREYNSSIEVDTKIKKTELRKEEKAEPEPDVVEEDEDKDEDFVEVLVQRAKDEFPNVPEAFFGPYRNLLATELLPNLPQGSIHRHLLKRMSQFQVNTPETQAMHDVIELASRMIDAKEDDSDDMFLHDDKELGDHFLINAWGETAKVSLQDKRSYRDFGDKDDKELGAYFEMPLEFATGVNQEAIFNSYLFFRDAYNFFRKSNPDFSVSEPVSEEIQDLIDVIQEEVDNGITNLKMLQDKVAEVLEDDSQELRNQVAEAYTEYTKRFTPDEINEAINKRLSDNLSSAFGIDDAVNVLNEDDLLALANRLGDVTYNATPEQKATQELLDAAQAEYRTAKKAFENKRKELGKAIVEDQRDLFGERVTPKAPGLFDERVSQSGRDKAMEPFKARMEKAEKEVNRLQKKMNDLGDQSAQGSLFHYQNTVRNFVAAALTSMALSTSTPVVSPNVKNTVTELVQKYYGVNDEKAPQEVIDRAIKLWERFGKPDIFGDSTDKNERAFADYKFIGDNRFGIRLSNITDFDDFVAELAHAAQFSSKAKLPAYLDYNSQEEYDKVEYERVGSLEYDAHQLIEPMIASYILFGKSKELFLTDDKLKEAEGAIKKYQLNDIFFQVTMPNGSKKTVKSVDVDVVNGFYSPLEKTINEFKGDKLPAKQWADKFKGEEAKWTGLTDWLKAQEEFGKTMQGKFIIKELKNGKFDVKWSEEGGSSLGWFDTKKQAEDFATGTVSKADIQKYLKENRIEVVEVVKTDEVVSSEHKKLQADKARAVERMTAISRELGGTNRRPFITGADLTWHIKKNNGNVEVPEKYHKELDELEEKIQKLEQHEQQLDNPMEGPEGATQYSTYQLPGTATNYKEVLITMPDTHTEARLKNSARTNNLIDKVKARQGEDAVRGFNIQDEFDRGRLTPEEAAEWTDIRNEKYPQRFTSNHWQEPNILAHVRMNTRTDADGKKVLFLEEIQSDWGEIGRKHGFSKEKRDIKNTPLKAEMSEDGYWVVSTMDGEFVGNVTEMDLFKTESQAIAEVRIRSENEPYRTRTSQQVQPAPFVTDTNAWTKLALKVALKEAVKQGADKIAWTTGEQQAERYDLSKQISGLSYAQNEKGNYYLRVIKKGRNAEWENLASDIPASKIEDYVGKEVANKIINGETGEKLGNWKFLHKVDLKVGGEGMTGFYGNPSKNKLGIVGNVAKSLFKQEPKTVTIETGPFQAASMYTGEANYVGGTGVYDSKGDMIAEFDTKEDADAYIEAQKQAQSIQHSIDITPELKAQVEAGLPLFMKSPDGKILGFTHNGKVYLNAAYLNPNTPIHEGGHIWTEWAEQYSKAVYNRGIELVEGSAYYDKVNASKTYQALAKQDALKAGPDGTKANLDAYIRYMKHEALAMAIGDRGAQFVTESKKKGFAEWLKNLWENIKNAVGFKNVTAAELSNMTFEEFTSRAAADVLREQQKPTGQEEQELTEEEELEQQEQQEWEDSDPIAEIEMTTSGEVADMISGKTIGEIFGETPEGDQSYDKQKLVDMLQDGKNMVGAAMGKWGSNLSDYGRPLFNYIKNMGADKSLMAKKVALMATFLGEIKEEIYRNPERMDELRPLENAVTAYYQNYMMQTAKSLSAGRILRLYRDKYMGDIFAHQILEEQEIRDQNSLRKLQQEQMDIDARVAAGIEEFKRITQEEKDIADAEAAEKNNDAKIKQQGKKNMAPTDAQKAAAAKAEKIKKNGRLDAIVDKIKNAINKCK